MVVPIASGSQFVKVEKGFASWSSSAWSTGPAVRVSGAQAAGCSPVATPSPGTAAIRPVQPDTVARSLAIGSPADGW